jgi:phosphoglycerol transferase MdoB-like AlkP superfamily enzyme
MNKIINNLKSAINNLTNHRHFQKYEKYASLIIWVLTIYYLSSQGLEFIGPFNVWGFIIRKIFHMFEFAVLALLVFRILRSTDKRHIYWDIAWTFIFTVLYAISDEYHQTLTPGRVGTYRDVLIDSFGALVAVWFLILDYKHRKIMESKNVINKLKRIIKRTP